MAGHLFFVPLPELHAVLPQVLREAVQTITLEHVIDGTGGYFDPVVAQQIPMDATLPEMLSAAQVQDFLFDVGGGAALGILRTRFTVDQCALAVSLGGPSPLVENLSGDAEVAASL
jgi:hypothetical protein